MTTNDDTPRDDEREPEDQTAETQAQPPGAGQRPRRLYRARRGRVLGGVCAGVADYFKIDPVIVRVVAVAATFFGGAGILLYLAALLLVPDDRGHVAADASSFRGKVLIGVAGVLLFVAVASAVPWGWGDWFLPGFIFPLAFLALLGAGIWWLVKGAGNGSGDGARGEPGTILRAVLLAFLLLCACALLAVGSTWASAVGGDVVVAGLVIAAGAMLVAGAFVGRVRWLILPALAVALPLALVSAAGIEVDNSVGERDYRPATAADIHDRYELGMGSLVVDLRDADLTAGDHELELKVGVGEALLLVPDDVCVASTADVGLGTVDVFDQDNGGADVSWDDRRDAPADTPRVIVNADIGIGAFEVGHERPDHWSDHRGFHDDTSGDALDRNNCEGDRA
ncbi:MAG TPA: PspC domain-containing protein [Thermoleophilaceae bacterium]